MSNFIVEVPKKIGSLRFCDEHGNLDYFGILLKAAGVSMRKLRKLKSAPYVGLRLPHEEAPPGEKWGYPAAHYLQKIYNIEDKDFPRKFLYYNDSETDQNKRKEYFINFLRRNNIPYRDNKYVK